MSHALNDEEREAARRLIELALFEDLNAVGDVTCRALIRDDLSGSVNIVARAEGVLAGVPVAQLVVRQLDRAVTWSDRFDDGARVARGTVIAELSGPLRSLLTAERTVLNFLTHLSGVATLTRKFVDAAAGKKAVILDTRKTLPGWRRLEKYAVRAGGGANHRMGLYDGCLIKDNHLAAWTTQGSIPWIASAVAAARKALAASRSGTTPMPVEVEVETIDQLTDALAGEPDIVLLDNMDVSTLRQCVQLRDRVAPGVLLEASGGITLATVADVAATGVDRISVGAITHSAPALDMAFDWA